VSLGGGIGIELALRHPERLRCLVAVSTVPRFGSHEFWLERAEHVRHEGTASLREPSARRWWGPRFEHREPILAARMLRALGEVDNESYARCAEALAAWDRTAESASISVPVVLVAGADDEVTSPAAVRSFSTRLPDAEYSEVAGAAHLVVTDHPDAVMRAVRRRLP
jgi:3-oxoadipate enol-lactonase / 4-carboxymuconolactone decarboxylase